MSCVSLRSTTARVLSVVLIVCLVITGGAPLVGPVAVVHASDVTPPPPVPAQDPVVGFVDTHLHQFANLGFGGLELWGSPMDPLRDTDWSTDARRDAARARALPDADYLYVSDADIADVRAAFGAPVTTPLSATHGPYANCPGGAPCWRVTIHGSDGSSDLLNTAIGEGANPGIKGYRPAGAGDAGLQWPTWSAVTSQQAYWEWLKRANDHGLHLMTMHAVNSTLLCNLGIGFFSFGCDDDSAVERQVQSAKDLEAYIDALSGGPGKGFYRIVYNSQQARDVIRTGKLAVVLGVEVDTPGGCTTARSCEDQVADLVQHYYDIGVRVVYPVHLIDNSFGGASQYTSFFEFNNFLVNGSFFNVTADCDSQLRYRSGIRDLLTPLFKAGVLLTLPILLGVVAGAIGLGGAALAPAVAAVLGLIGPALSAVPVLGVVGTLAATSIAAASFLMTLVAAIFASLGPVGAPPAANCNSRPLTNAGIAFVNALMDHHMLIDVDHTDELGFDQILDIAVARKYPGIVSGHTGLVGAGHTQEESGIIPDKTARHEGNKTDRMVQRIDGVGGFVSIIPHQGNLQRIVNFAEPTVPFDCGESSQAWAQVYLYATKTLQLKAVGIGSDMNGFAGMVAPRYGPEACGGSALENRPAGYDPNRPDGRIDYASLTDYFGNPLEQYSFGNKTWDFNTDGLAHVGLYPDFIADLQAIGLSHDELGPLFNGAEAYVKMWEKIEDNQAPTVTCGTVGEDWHAADVSVPCNAYDIGYGLQKAADASFTLSTTVPEGSETGDASTGTHGPICDAGGHCTGTIPAITGINVDKKDPTVSVVTPAAGTPTYTLNGTVLADYTCSDGGSGVKSCTGPKASGVALDTSVGVHQFTVVGTDNVGNSTSEPRPYQVTYAICTLYDTARPAAAGSTVPVKIRLCDANGGNYSSAAITLTAIGVDGTPPPPPSSGNANAGNVFRFDVASQTYIFNLKTTGMASGAHTLTFAIAGDPVSSHDAAFAVR